MRAIALIVLLVFMAGCVHKEESHTEPEEVRIKCINGVEYYIFREAVLNRGYGYMAVKYTREGNISFCE